MRPLFGMTGLRQKRASVKSRGVVYEVDPSVGSVVRL